jgi:hypothetical protein
MAYDCEFYAPDIAFHLSAVQNDAQTLVNLLNG